MAVSPRTASAAPATNAVGDEDPLSPTVQVRSYLASRGLQPTSQNVYNALQGNAYTGANVAGPPLISGLVNEAPSTDPSVGQSGNVAGVVEKAPGTGSTTPTRVADTGQWDLTSPAGGGPASGGNTSAPPTTGGSTGLNLGNLGAAILGGLGAGGLAGAGMRYMGPGTQAASVVPTLGAAAGPTPEVNVQLQPQPAQTGDRYSVAPTAEAQTTPFDTAMNRAVTPATSTVPWMQGNPTSAITPDTSMDLGSRVTNPAQMPTTVQSPGRRLGLATDPVTGNLRSSPIPAAPVRVRPRLQLR
jgi:hypothetical protein